MFQENEIVTAILGVCVLLFFINRRVRFREFPALKTFTAFICVSVAAWILTIVEGIWVGFKAELLLNSFFNAAEHLCYTGNSLLFTLWLWNAYRERKEKTRP